MLKINQTFCAAENMILNTTLLNDTLQSFTFWNATTGWYNLTLEFYDNHSNWQLWVINFTIIPVISISTGYQNPHFINTNNTISVNILTEYSIDEIYYDNSTEYIEEYNDPVSSMPIILRFNILYSVETQYNISICVIGEYDDIFYINISNLCVIERTTLFRYYQFKD